MSRYIHTGSFVPPAERQFEDNRNRCDAALKKIFAAGPQRPGSLMQKRAQSDVALTLPLSKKLSRQERLRRSNAAEALEAVRKVHGRGTRGSLGEPQGDAPFESRSVAAVAKAQRLAVHVGDHRMLSARELNKAFSQAPRSTNVDIDIELRKSGKVHHTVNTGKFTYDFDARGRVLNKRLSARKAFDGPNRIQANGPQNSNSNWNDEHADTGASNNWHDIAIPSERPTTIGSQHTVTPPMTDRDAAVDAIKRALRKPQKLWGNNSDMDDDQDRTDDLYADDEDLDDDGDTDKDPNRADAFE